MSATALIARGRAAAERLMVDACTIKRVASSTTSLTTGVITPTYTTMYSGKCRIQQRTQGLARPHEAGEAHLLLLQMEVHLPMTSAAFQVDDQVTITASALDVDLVGRIFYVRDLFHKTHATARRVSVQERTS